MVMATQCRIAVVDKCPIFVLGIDLAIRQDNRLLMVAHGSTTADLERIVCEIPHDILVLDDTIAGSQLAIMSDHARSTALKVIYVASVVSWDRAVPPRRASARGYITRHTTAPELIRTILAVHNGQRYIAPELAWHLATARTKVSETEQLSKREQQVLELTTKGMSNWEIAKVLSLGLSTVKLYKTNIFRKLGVRNRLEAIAAMQTIRPVGSRVG
jgi:DNA-binding NarL/FixJ family response regulator